MLQEMLLGTLWGKGILILSFTAVLLQMITVLSYKRMKQAAENPGKSKKPWVMLLKKRYESYERFGRIRNVEAFVEHYFARKGIWGIPLSMWDKAGILCTLLTAFTGILGAAASYNRGADMRRMMGIFLLGGAGTLFLLLVHRLTDSAHVKREIVAALTDYLANGTVHRGTEGKDESGRKLPTKEELASLDEAAVTEEEKVVLEEVLEEYFW